MTVLGTVDRRVLGAFRCVDAASLQQIQQGVRASSAGLDIRRTASGVFVVFGATGMGGLTTRFDLDPAVAWPAPQPFVVDLRPVGSRYLPRRATVAMPRQPVPPSDAASSMIPQDVPMYPGPAAVTGALWAVIRASVTLGAGGDPAPWPVLRLVRDSDHSVLAAGAGTRGGEAVIAVPGIGVTSNPNGGGAVLTATVDATLTAYVDPATLSAVAADADWLPNPDDVLNNLANAGLKTHSQAVKIGRGTQSHVKLPIAV